MYLQTSMLVILAVGAAAKSYPPNVDAVSYAVNLLLGKTPYEQRKHGIGQKLFQWSDGEDLPGLPYLLPKQARGISTSPDCLWSDASSGVSWSTSEQTLEEQSKSSSSGYDRSVDLKAEYKGVSASSTVRNAAVHGNSRASTKQWESREQGYTYTYGAASRRSLYSVEVDFEDMDEASWTHDFKRAVAKLGHRPSDVAIVRFFEDFGTHGMEWAGMGEHCSASVFMEGGFSFSAYEEHNTKSWSKDKAFWGFIRTSQGSTSNQHSKDATYQFDVKRSVKHCVGEIGAASNCHPDAGFRKTSNNPALVAWSFLPIWDMAVPGLTSGAKSRMEHVFGWILSGAEECGRNHCHGHGVCAPRLTAWSRIGSSLPSASSFWDGNKCFCDKKRVGRSCGKSRHVPILRSGWTVFLNKFDKPVDFTAPAAICGIGSYHSNKHEDRRWKFRTCAPQGVSARATNAPQDKRYTWDDRKRSKYFRKECTRPGDVLHAVYSVHKNKPEDRAWDFTCRAFGGGKVHSCRWSGYVNNFDKAFYYSCGSGRVLAGASSYEENKHEDRRWQFKCCDWSFSL